MHANLLATSFRLGPSLPIHSSDSPHTPPLHTPEIPVDTHTHPNAHTLAHEPSSSTASALSCMQTFVKKCRGQHGKPPPPLDLKSVCVLLQCVAVCCSVLHCATPPLDFKCVCVLLQCVVVCVAVCSSVMQCAAACCSVLQCVAACCSVLHCAAPPLDLKSVCVLL